MEFKGETFAQNVQMKQKKAELLNQINEIDNKISDNPYVQHEPVSSPLEDDAVILDTPEQELGDLILDESANETDKKKYIILGLALLLLFVLTVLIIKLMGSWDDDKTKKSLIDDNKETLTQDEALNNTDIEKQYQNIIKKKMAEIKKDTIPLDIEETKKVVEPIKKPEPKKDIFELEKKSEKLIEKLKKEDKKTQVDTKTVEKKVKKDVKQLFTSKPKKQVVKKPTVTNFSKTSTNIKPTGVFVQIGAYSKTPNDKFLKNIKNNGYNYNLYKVEVKGKLYVKVLIGPFKSKAQAKNNLDDIKSKFKASGAYVVKF
jgi:DedD protein